MDPLKTNAALADNRIAASTRLSLCIAALLGLISAPFAPAVSPSADEMAEASRWSTSLFDGRPASNALQPGLEVVANLDPVQKNARFGRPLKLGDKRYAHGLFCHATSRIVVRLPSPGKVFEAILGVDSNEQTAGGKGSVVFAVQMAGTNAFQSGVLREGMTPVPVKVGLGGAREFVLEVRDAGDGVSCDQADWAEARISLADGTTLWLADLPMAGGPAVADPATPPFSFVYGGKPSAELLKTWKAERSAKALDDQRIERVVTYTDPETGLVIRCVGIGYRDFPTVEWTLHFKNTGTTATPILEKIQALDMRFARGVYGEYLLHHAVGSPCAVNDYAPIETPLPPGTEKRIGAAGGRPTNSDWSYFNLETPTGHGAIVVVGWPGQWSSLWSRDDGTGLRVQAGQELTHFKLLPGEEVRSPLIVLQFYSGDWIRAQNIWRQWMLAHNVPKPGGKLPQPQLFGCSSHLFNEMIDANEENQKLCIRRYLDEKIPISYWWMDAGWYPMDSAGWVKTGTWEVDTNRFPKGLRAISNYAHDRGLKTLLWFEPERVAGATWLTRTHPEWILGGANGGLLNLGNPEAWSWLVNHVDELMTEQGIDLYRQDFNMDPLDFWRRADAPDRQGITEIKHVTGYLAYWDELLKRHPNMFIDSCASGGRRNDLETLRRSIPLWRTDYRCEPIGTECCSYGISLWLPFSGTGAADVDAYTFRGNMAPFTILLADIRDRRLDYDLFRRLVRQWQQIADCYLGDFYPLTSYSTGKDTWMAWQFNCPEKGNGVVQAFRRDKCIFETGRLKLFGLDANSRYEVVDLDRGKRQQFDGRTLMEKGLSVTISDQPGAAVITYRKKP